MMLLSRHGAQFGLAAAGLIFLLAFSIVVAGAFEKPRERVGLPGSPAASFRLPDLGNNMVSSSTMHGSIIVLCFAPSPANPLSIDDANRLADLAKKYPSDRDVKFVQIFSDVDGTVTEDIHQIRSRAALAGSRCLTLIDPTSRIAGRYSVDEMPIFFVIDSAGIIRYRGAIDDPSPNAPLSATSFTSMIDLLLAERPLSVRPSIFSNN
jgi:peroxiredoxin